jgi:hypothetical protein
VHPDEVSDSALLDVASDLVVELLRQVRLETRRADVVRSGGDDLGA